MWKHLTRTVKDALQRKINLRQDTKPSTIECQPIVCGSDSKKVYPVLDQANNKFCGSSCGEHDHEKKNQERLRRDHHICHATWLEALGWSSALVLGWYLTQPLCWRRFFQNRPRSETQHGPTHNERVCPLNQLVKFAFNQPLHWVLPPLNSTATLRQYHQHEREEETRRDCEECASFETPTVEEHSFIRAFRDVHSGCLLLYKQHMARIMKRALDKAADDFEHVHNTLVGKLENRKGVELMQAGHYKEAVKLFRRASDYYSAPGAFNLGLSYEKGQGTLQSWKRAAKWYQIASDRGHAEAMYNLGVMYVHGRGGLPMDYDKAKNLFESAAKLGQPDALHALDMAKHTPVTDDQDSQINRELLFKRHNDVEELYEALGINKSDQDRVLSNPIEVQSQNTLEIVQAKVLRATDVILQAVGIVNLQSQKKLEENIISNHSEELNDFEMFAAEQQELHDNYNVRNDLIKNMRHPKASQCTVWEPLAYTQLN
uniref:Uncharacterized protein n=1 Tax=Timema poppense TaxID=170557 RepID=A0A7R9H0E0_TIMPO|nr:unnamed protein product [Timema poppensis]